MLLRPDLPSCEDCKTWWYDHDWQIVTDTEQKPCKRPKPITEEDCKYCDKRQFGLEDLLDYNQQAYDVYNRVKAAGATVEELNDDRFCRNISLLEQTVRQASEINQARQTAELLSSMFQAMAR